MSELLGVLRETARAHPARGWLETRGSDGEFLREDWARIHLDARRAAASLAARGIGAGDAVALFMGSPRHVAVATQACWLRGASVTMLHQPTARTNLTTYAADTFGILQTIDADALVLGPPYADVVEHFAPAASDASAAILTSDELLAGERLIDPDPAVADESSPALLQLTSGSTAAPKAVVITHGNLISNMRAMVEVSDIRADDIMLSWLPVFHDMGMVGFLCVPMVFGLKLVKVTPADFVASPASWMRLISDRGASITAAPNFAYGIAARALSKAAPLDLSTLRIALNGAEPIDPRTVELFCEAGERHGLDPSAVLCAYGMAEAALAGSVAPVGRGLVIATVDERVLGAQRVAKPVEGAGSAFALLGAPLGGIEVEVRGEKGEVLPERHVGTLMIRGDAVSPGYVTAEGLRGSQDAEGWLDTGDEGYLVDGEVVVCGRIKDLIIIGGRNIYPTDVERAAERVEGVRRGNCAAVPVLVGGREVLAVVAESTYYDDEQHRGRIEQEIRVATYADLEVRPTYVVLIAPGALPKTPSGKIQRVKVRESIQRRIGGEHAAP
ncbi:long-chain-fatty-acid--CoA ligase [Blastococcus sp. Marseille-P5729]|uniref:long-chain-fatty-acid--CoA ligase n=1 Tax=Blastococcus sp. Marseille-P5729 TaxID=2086582 RepID=UPI000D0E8B49|nr:long-chain-fatty-acid--CoA ligase [Blastococcus sp. Marseille-P5729]